MGSRRFRPGLNKKFLTAREGYDFYTVNVFAIRNGNKTNQEIDNFATPGEFPGLIPDGEVWISARSAPREAEFFIANALARLRALADGASDGTAYAVGRNAERKLRRQRTGIEYRAGRPHPRVPADIYVRPYTILEDGRGPVRVWLVDGCLVRCTYRTEFVAGGHGYVYPWVPKDEIWVERETDPAEVPFVLAHEFVERQLMRDDGREYDPAHRVAADAEFDLRRAASRARFPGFTRRRVRKPDLKELAAPAFMAYVRRNYPRGTAPRDGDFRAPVTR
jgi:hypothetical protein